MTINFHIGVPRVGADLLQAVSTAVKRDGKSSLYILPQRSYRNSLRAIVNGKDLQTPGGTETLGEAVKLIRSLASYRTVAASQHALLGTPAELVASRKKLQRVVPRVSALSKLFEAYPLSLHLSITSQSEYVSELNGENRSDLSEDAIPTWAELVGLLREAVPSRNLVVWDFERPAQIALAFLISLLETDDPALIQELQRIVYDQPSLLKVAHVGPVFDGLGDLISRLDARYEADLESISMMEGVSLIRSDAIPAELHIW